MKNIIAIFVPVFCVWYGLQPYHIFIFSFLTGFLSATLILYTGDYHD
jgi:uncharacterized membrane protein